MGREERGREERRGREIGREGASEGRRREGREGASERGREGGSK